MKDVILWGATGQARVIREALAPCEFNFLAIFDNKPLHSPFIGVPIYLGKEGFCSWLEKRRDADTLYACVTIGGCRGSERMALQEYLRAQGIRPLTVVHPRAFVASDARVGEGTQILAMAAVCANVRLGSAVIVNTSASIDHDCLIEDGVHIGPGAVLAGEVHVGEHAFVGSGAVVLPRIKIGRRAIVGAGAVVIRDVPADQVVVGNPAKPLSRQANNSLA